MSEEDRGNGLRKERDEGKHDDKRAEIPAHDANRERAFGIVEHGKPRRRARWCKGSLRPKLRDGGAAGEKNQPPDGNKDRIAVNHSQDEEQRYLGDSGVEWSSSENRYGDYRYTDNTEEEKASGDDQQRNARPFAQAHDLNAGEDDEQSAQKQEYPEAVKKWPHRGGEWRADTNARRGKNDEHQCGKQNSKHTDENGGESGD